MLVGCLLCGGLSAGGQEDRAYDDLEARGLQLLENGSFEATDREAVVPAVWGVYKTVKDRLRLVVDPKGSRHGVNFVTFSPDRPRGLWGRLKSFPKGKHRVSAWAKGKGKLAFRVGAVRRGWQALPVSKKMLASQGSPQFTIEPTQWTLATWEFELPDTYTVDGKTEKTDLVTFNMLISGTLSIDECMVVPVSALQAAVASTKPLKQKADVGGAFGDLRPSLTAPHLAKAPVLDGKLGEDEWAGAAAVTGFTALDSRQWTSRQAAVFVGFDDEKLYVAFRCPHEGRIDTDEPVRDRVGTQQSQGIEIWLQPPGGHWYQFLGRPGGVIVDVSQKEHFGWNGNWVFREQISDVAEEIGGVLSFRKKLWTAEIAIPLADLGVTRVSDGDSWRVNFTRDYGVPKGKKRSQNDWTSWAPIRSSFKEVKEFGKATCRRDAPAVQLLTLGDLADGDLSLKGKCTANHQGLRVSARAALAETGKTLLFRSVDVPAGQAGPFELADTLKVNETTKAVYEIEVAETDSQRVLASSKIPFTAIAALRVTAIPVFSQQTLYLNADASRVANLPADLTVDASVSSSGAPVDLTAADTWRNGQLTGDLALPIAGLSPGRYQAKVHLRTKPDAEPLVASVASFTIPEPPQWLGNKLGMTDRVPSPWMPVLVDGDRVRVTQRDYVLGPIGLPAQVTALGRELFSAAPQLKLALAGREMAWEVSPAQLLKRDDRQAVWRLSAKAGPIELAGTVAIEFDGFARWDFSVSSVEPTQLDGLAMDFPFRKERSLYARGKDSTVDDRGSFAALLNGTGEPEDVLIAGGHYCGIGWIWPNQW